MGDALCWYEFELVKFAKLRASRAFAPYVPYSRALPTPMYQGIFMKYLSLHSVDIGQDHR